MSQDKLLEQMSGKVGEVHAHTLWKASTVQKVMPSTYNGDTDLSEYLASFDRITVSHRLSDYDKATMLLGRLQGKARQYVAGLEDEDFPTMVKALKRRLLEPQDMYMSRLRHRKQQKTESLADFALAIESLSQQACADKVSRETARKDVFIEGIRNGEIRKMVRNMVPPTYEASVTLAERLTFNQEVEADMTSVKPGQGRGETARLGESVVEPPSKLELEVKDLGEKLRQLQTEGEKVKGAAAAKPKSQSGGGANKSYRGRGGRGQGGGRGAPRKPLICWKCDFEGHIERFCPFASGARPFRDGSSRDRGYQRPSTYDRDRRDDYDRRDSYHRDHRNRSPSPPPPGRGVHAQENSRGPHH